MKHHRANRSSVDNVVFAPFAPSAQSRRPDTPTWHRWACNFVCRTGNRQHRTYNEWSLVPYAIETLCRRAGRTETMTPWQPDASFLICEILDARNSHTVFSPLPKSPTNNSLCLNHYLLWNIKTFCHYWAHACSANGLRIKQIELECGSGI